MFLRARTSAIKDSLLGDASPLDAVVYGAPFPLAGPQARCWGWNGVLRWLGRLRWPCRRHERLQPCPLFHPLFGVASPPWSLQIRVKYASTPATRFRPAAAELQAELGQMLACVRIKQQASMNAFATQLTQITSALGRPSGGKEAACKAAVVDQPPSPTAHLPTLQSALKVGRSAGGRCGCRLPANACIVRVSSVCSKWS